MISEAKKWTAARREREIVFNVAGVARSFTLLGDLIQHGNVVEFDVKGRAEDLDWLGSKTYKATGSTEHVKVVAEDEAMIHGNMGGVVSTGENRCRVTVWREKMRWM